MTGRAAGRTRIALAALLAQHGFKVEPSRIHRGATSARGAIDAYAWDVDATRDGVGCYLASDDTMGECVRRGITVATVRNRPTQFRVHASSER